MFISQPDFAARLPPQPMALAAPPYHGGGECYGSSFKHGSSYQLSTCHIYYIFLVHGINSV